MRTFALASGLALAACGGTESGGSLEILSCSLNCGSSGNGPLTCSINQVAVNGSIAVLFSQPINPDSLNSISFRVVSETGTTPLGEYVIDPANPARVFFRPLVTFGSDGLPEFGLDPLLDYDIEIPAFTPGALGFFVESTSGARNSTELACTVAPSLGVDDVNDGAPVVEAFVEEIIPIFDNGEQIGVEVVGSESLVGIEPGVETSSRLRFEFDDVMNPATLVNTVTNTSPSISVRVDIDGDLTDSADQLVIPGTFTLDINQNLNEAATTVIYTPTTPFPTAGVDDGGLPRAIVVELPNSISDLGGNGLANAGTLTFVTTTQPAPIPEDFLLTFADGLLFDQDFEAARLDPAESGVLIDVGYSGTFDGELLDGRLLRALGGGSGRLGALQVAPGEEVFLSTGPIPTVFGPNLTTGSVVDGMGDVVEYRVQSSIVDDGLYAVEPFLAPGQPAWFEDDDPSTGPGLTTQTVTDGVFEFSSLDIQPGGRLTFVGDSPARLFVRGRAKIDGLVRTEGESSRGDLDSLGELDEVPLDGPPIPEEDTNGNGLGDGFGGAGGAPGSGGGRGGDGGDRVDAPNLVGVGPPGGGAGDVPPGGAFPWGFAGFADAIDIELDGGAGEGRNGLAPAGGDDFGAGQPGLRYPAVFPTTTTGALDDFGDLILNSFCESRQFGPGGAGGSFAVPGGEPTWDLSPGQAAFGGVVPPPLPVGSTSLLRAFEQELDPSRPGGQLVGGAGGGGGGTGAAFATTTGLPLNCGTGNPGLGGVLQFLDFIDGLGAGGGGGGGAIQIQAGFELVLNGAISVRGGGGGGIFGNQVSVRGASAPGGGGSGGSLLLQAYDVDLAPFPGLLDVSGGAGGFNTPTGSTGGDGSPGIVQVENGSSLADFGPTFANFAPPALTLEGTASRVSPALSLTEPSATGGPFNASDVLNVGGFAPNGSGAGARFGFQTCWLVPETEAFAVEFQGDMPDGMGGTIPGWDLVLELGEVVPMPTLVSFRGDPGPLAALTGNLSIEEAAGNSLGTSPVVVRFQGARAVDPIDDPCAVFLDGPASPLLAGSLTPWLSSPEEVTEYFTLLSTLNPAVDQGADAATQQAQLDAQIDPANQISPGLASQRQANIIRAQVILDQTSLVGSAVLSVVQLELTALTD